MQRDAGCTIVEATRGDRQRGLGKGVTMATERSTHDVKYIEVSGGEMGG